VASFPVRAYCIVFHLFSGKRRVPLRRRRDGVLFFGGINCEMAVRFFAGPRKLIPSSARTWRSEFPSRALSSVDVFFSTWHQRPGLPEDKRSSWPFCKTTFFRFRFLSPPLSLFYLTSVFPFPCRSASFPSVCHCASLLSSHGGRAEHYIFFFY